MRKDFDEKNKNRDFVILREIQKSKKDDFLT